MRSALLSFRQRALTLDVPIALGLAARQQAVVDPGGGGAGLGGAHRGALLERREVGALAVAAVAAFALGSAYNMKRGNDTLRWLRARPAPPIEEGIPLHVAVVAEPA